MARGKIQIRKIENPTNRQVTFSKRRNGLVKKAKELSVLCDAKVSVIILSGTGKLHEYTSESTSTKELIDLYQSASRTDIWSSQYEKMQEQLKMLREKNQDLRMQISQRMGKCLDGLDFKELHELEVEMEEAEKTIRERKCDIQLGRGPGEKGYILSEIKRNMDAFDEAITEEACQFSAIEVKKQYKVMTNKINTTNKKLNQAEQRIRNAFLTEDDLDYESPGGHYDSIAGCPNGFPNVLALGLQLNQPSLQAEAESIITPWGVHKF